MDNLLTNKYFCIAIIIAFIVVLYLYSRKKSCEVEGMQNVDLTPLAQELTQPPWTDRYDGDDHRHVNNKFDRFADAYTKRKLKKEGYSYTDFLKRSDDTYRKYVDMEGYDSMMPEDNKPSRRRLRLNPDEAPKPLDDRPDLSQCQPCRCPQDTLIATEDIDDISESEEYEPQPRPVKPKPMPAKKKPMRKLKKN